MQTNQNTRPLTDKEFDPTLITWNDPETVEARLEYYRTHWTTLFPNEQSIEAFRDQ